MNKEKRIADEELNHVCGGRDGSNRSVYEAVCPGCGHVYKIKGPTVKINCGCGTSFYPAER